MRPVLLLLSTTAFAEPTPSPGSAPSSDEAASLHIASFDGQICEQEARLDLYRALENTSGEAFVLQTRGVVGAIDDPDKISPVTLAAYGLVVGRAEVEGVVEGVVDDDVDLFFVRDPGADHGRQLTPGEIAALAPCEIGAWPITVKRSVSGAVFFIRDSRFSVEGKVMIGDSHTRLAEHFPAAEVLIGGMDDEPYYHLDRLSAEYNQQTGAIDMITVVVPRVQADTP